MPGPGRARVPWVRGRYEWQYFSRRKQQQDMNRHWSLLTQSHLGLLDCKGTDKCSELWSWGDQWEPYREGLRCSLNLTCEEQEARTHRRLVRGEGSNLPELKSFFPLPACSGNSWCHTNIQSEFLLFLNVLFLLVLRAAAFPDANWQLCSQTAVLRGGPRPNSIKPEAGTPESGPGHFCFHKPPGDSEAH